MIWNKKGELAMNTKQKAEIWNEYFDNLPITEELKEVIKIRNREINEVEVEQLTTEDVKKDSEKFKKITRQQELMEYTQN